MSRPTTYRLLAGGLLLLVTLATTGLGPAPAYADDHEFVTITGGELAEPITLDAEEHPNRYAAMHAELGWLVDRGSSAPEPDPDLLGPLFTVILHVEGEPRHRLHLYPLAQGGPRVQRPAEQPGDESVREAWHFGRLSLPQTLVDVGVPMPSHPATVGGGLGGDLDGPATAEPERGGLAFLDEWREGMVLTAGAALAVLAGLASIAFLVRRER